MQDMTIDTANPTNRILLITLFLPTHPPTTDHSAPSTFLAAPHLLPLDDTLPQQAIAKHQPKPTQHSQVESNIEQPWTIKNHCKRSDHTVINNTILVLTTGSNITPPTPTPYNGTTPNWQWTMDIQGAFQHLTDAVFSLTTTAHLHDTMFLSQLQCLFYPPMLLYNIRQSEWPTTNNQPMGPLHTAKQHSFTMQVHINTITSISNHTALKHAMHAMTMNAANDQSNNSKIHQTMHTNHHPCIFYSSSYSSTCSFTLYHTYLTTYHLWKTYTLIKKVPAYTAINVLPTILLAPTVKPSTTVLIPTTTGTHTMTTIIKPTTHQSGLYILRTIYCPPK